MTTDNYRNFYSTVIFDPIHDIMAVPFLDRRGWHREKWLKRSRQEVACWTSVAEFKKHRIQKILDKQKATSQHTNDNRPLTP